MLLYLLGDLQTGYLIVIYTRIWIMYHVMEQLAELNKHFSWKQTGMLVEMHDLF